MERTRTILAFLLVFGCRSAEAPKPDAQAPAVGEPQTSEGRIGTVALEFGWTEQMSAVMDVVVTEVTMVGEERRDVSKSEGRLQLRTAPAERGLRVDVDDPEGDVQAGGGREARDWMAPFVAGDDGRFVGLADPERVQERHDAITEALAKESADPEAVRRRLAGVDFVGMTREKARKRWHAWVGVWAGATLELGESYANEEVFVRAIGRVPCDGAGSGAERGCVELELLQKLGPDELQEEIGDLFAAVGGLPVVDDLRGARRVSIVTEEETLVPHRVESELITSMVATIDGETSEVRSEKREISTFHWTVRP